MAFKLNDTVVVFSKPNSVGAVVGMKGFIDEVFDDDYYRFAYVGNLPDGLDDVPEKVYAEGGIDGKHLAHDNDPRLVKCVKIILEEREIEHKKLIAKIELRRIFEGK